MFFLNRRRGAQRAAQNAAMRDGGGTLLHELPEFMLPTALHILAHHPDYPTPEVLMQLLLIATGLHVPHHLWCRLP